MTKLSAVPSFVRAASRERELHRHEGFDRARLDKHQRQALARIVAHARARSRFYRDLYADHGVDEQTPLHLLPPVDKTDLMERFDDWVTDPSVTLAGAQHHLSSGSEGLLADRFVVAASGGSSRRPGVFVFDPNEWDAVCAIALRASRWCGLTPRLPRRRVAFVHAPGSQHMADRVTRTFELGIHRAQRLAATQPTDELVATLNEFRPTALVGCASVIALLAAQQIDGQLNIAPSIVLTDGEPRSAEMTDRIRTAWRSEPFDYYAVTETGGGLALDCQAHDGRHVFEDTSIVEIVDADDRPVWFASDFATELPWFFNLILGGFRGPEPGGRNDGERQAQSASAADAGGEVGDLLGGGLAGDFAGRRGAEVRRRRERDHPVAGVGEGRGVGCVRVGEARPGGLARAGGAGGRPSGERSAVGGAEGDGSGVDFVPGKATLGLFGPVPARVSAEVKFELLGLIDQAVADGWAHARACRVLDLPDSRAHHWRQRLRETGTLQDGRPGGGAVHGLLAWEEQAILDLIEQWGPVDRSHRKLAHRGSYTDTVFVSPSTLLRVALKHRIRLLGERFRPRPPKLPFPEISWEKNRIWIWDATHFTRAKRVAYAIVDVVTRYWIGYLLSSEQTHTQVQLLFARALEDQGLLGPDGLPLRDDDEDGPILVAWSDNGAEMTAIDTRQFMALMAIAQHHGRPGTPTDQAHVESFFSHLKGDWANLLAITDPGALDTELARIRGQYNTVRLHASIGYVTPEDEHHGRGPGIRRARIAGMRRAQTERIKQNRANKK